MAYGTRGLPHLHLIVTDGSFSGSGIFTKGPGPVAKDLEDLLRYEVLKMLKAEAKISDAVIENMLSWRHSCVIYGFSKKLGSAHTENLSN